MSKATPSLDPLPEHVLPHWRRLQEALQEHWPTPCANDPGYTDDEPPAEVLALCGHCPTLEACRSFAEAWQPTAGVWAGELWPRRKQRRRTAEEFPNVLVINTGNNPKEQ